jgi:hypothetical protein
MSPEIQPLTYTHRSTFFYILAFIFLISLPFLFLYATGYRFTLKEGTFVSTGGIYVAAERTGAEIYIDNELVRETRAFRRAFYAQNLEPGTHRVHVQKEGHHTWVKELPVYAHLVTEAQAFNIPVVPEVRIVSPWRDANNKTVLFASSTLYASTTNDVVVSTSTATTTLRADTEFRTLIDLFLSTTTEEEEESNDFNFATALPNLSATSTPTTTKEVSGVKIFESDEDVFVSYIGSREDMPYYYCAEDFPLLGTSTAPLLTETEQKLKQAAVAAGAALTDDLEAPVQKVTPESVCDQTIKIDRQNQSIRSFDFFPGSTDLVLMSLDFGIYVVEVDDRAWQNSQPLLLGRELNMRVENGQIYVYDGSLIYQVILEN